MSDARLHREDARRLLVNDTDPGEVKKAVKEAEKELRANTFRKLALEWHERRDIFPVIGDTPLSELSFRLILEKVLCSIEDRTAIDLSHRIRSILLQVLIGTLFG